MKDLSNKIQIAVFLLFTGVFFVLLVLLPDKQFSQQENRYLLQAPRLTTETFFNGVFTTKFETYITDQFPARDAWIALKAGTERVLLKTENNSAYFCADDTLINRFERPDMTLVSRNIAAVNTLTANAGVPVYFTLIPGAVDIWDYKLPANAPNYSQEELIAAIYLQSDAVTVDTRKALLDQREEYIYYRTDHHWTSLGAYYAYCALMKSFGITPNPIDKYTPVTVTSDFYGTVYSSSGVRWVAPDSMEIYVPDEGVEVFAYESGKEIAGTLYDFSYLDEKDKYSMFLGGNKALVKIVTGQSDKPKLLILRDSYADSEIPFLLEHFSELHLIDLRYYKLSVKAYIGENDIDAVLVSYGLSNFVSDNSIFMAAV